MSHRVTIKSIKNQELIADKCIEQLSFWKRLKGLIGVTHLESGQGMFFPQCNSVHMWFMKMSIDVVFLIKSEVLNHQTIYEVSSLYSSVRPWKFLPLTQFKATDTLELPEGSIIRHQLKVGDKICIN